MSDNLISTGIETMLDRWGNVKLTFTIPKELRKEAFALADKIAEVVSKGKKIALSAKQHRQKRSLDANAYCWKIISEIADVLTADGCAHTKEEVYFTMLKRYGQQGIVKVPPDSVSNFKKQWKYCEEHETLFDEKAVYYRFWVGSSNYDSKEMFIFICGVRDEAEALGIDTRTPDEIAKMANLWKSEQSA